MTHCLLSRARLVAGVEVGGDHDADGLHPAGHLADRVEAAFSEDVVFRMRPLFARGGVAAAGLFDPKKLEALVIFFEPAGHRSEVVTTAARQSR